MLRAHTSDVTAITFVALRRRVAAAADATAPEAYSTAQQDEVAGEPGEAGGVGGVDWLVASGSLAGDVKIWSAESRRVLTEVPAHEGGVIWLETLRHGHRGGDSVSDGSGGSVDSSSSTTTSTTRTANGAGHLLSLGRDSLVLLWTVERGEGRGEVVLRCHRSIATGSYTFCNCSALWSYEQAGGGGSGGGSGGGDGIGGGGGGIGDAGDDRERGGGSGGVGSAWLDNVLVATASAEGTEVNVWSMGGQGAVLCTLVPPEGPKLGMCMCLKLLGVRGVKADDCDEDAEEEEASAMVAAMAVEAEIGHTTVGAAGHTGGRGGGRGDNVGQGETKADRDSSCGGGSTMDKRQDRARRQQGQPGQGHDRVIVLAGYEDGTLRFFDDLTRTCGRSATTATSETTATAAPPPSVEANGLMGLAAALAEGEAPSTAATRDPPPPMPSPTPTTDTSVLPVVGELVEGGFFKRFIPSSSFAGPKDGFVYTTREEGVGYYKQDNSSGAAAGGVAAAAAAADMAAVAGNSEASAVPTPTEPYPTDQLPCAALSLHEEPLLCFDAVVVRVSTPRAADRTRSTSAGTATTATTATTSTIIKGVTGAADDQVVVFSYNVEGKCAKVLGRLTLPQPGVSSIRIRDDKRIFATAGWDRRVRIFDFRKLRPLAVLRFHTDNVHAVAFGPVAPAGLLASGAKDSRVALWSMYPGKDKGGGEKKKKKSKKKTGAGKEGGRRRMGGEGVD